MAECNAHNCIEPVDAGAEIRLPVAYSHGGFAQMRHMAVDATANPLGPIPVPVSGVTDLPAELVPHSVR